ncbi:serine hydrolase domain-containing protein [Massilia sp. TN1-12]|uniref:serine hydrolase domain-containing protein n=1 Tax=Massilia paldalensis TaxID=3377675 RepID=UPI00384B099D
MNRRQCMAFAGLAALSGVVPVDAVTVPCYEAALAAYPDFSGTVVAGKGAELLFGRALGRSDPQAGTPMALDTRFETGSVSKWIAAIVVMTLVDQGKLALDAPIVRYLPDYRADTGARLTLRHLMSHSSGVPNDVMAARKADPKAMPARLDQMDAVRRYASGDLAFAPGTDWDYAHSNWIIVQAIVERVGGRRYRDAVAASLTEPLGLRDSGIFDGESSVVPGMAVAYAGAAPPWVRKVSAMPDYLAMAGGFYSSAPDMLRLMDGVLGGDRILSAASRATLMRVQRPAQRYALGGRTQVETIGGREREAAWEDGSNGGFRLVARRVLADGVSVIVFNNSSYDHRRLGELASALMEAVYA